MIFRQLKTYQLVLVIVIVGILSWLIILNIALDTSYNCNLENQVASCTISNSSYFYIETLNLVDEKYLFNIVDYFSPVLSSLFGRNDLEAILSSASEYKDNNPEYIISQIGYLVGHYLPSETKPNSYYLNQTKPGEQISQFVLFLHGYGGNFGIYQQRLLDILDSKDNTLIISPTYKNGRWDNESIEFIKQVLEDLEQRLNMEIEDLIVIAHSNGGLMIDEILETEELEVNKVIYISSYVQNEINNFPTCYIYGEDDNYIGISESTNNLANNSFAKIVSTPNVGHELFFDEELVALIQSCLSFH